MYCNLTFCRISYCAATTEIRAATPPPLPRRHSVMLKLLDATDCRTREGPSGVYKRVTLSFKLGVMYTVNSVIITVENVWNAICIGKLTTFGIATCICLCGLQCQYRGRLLWEKKVIAEFCWEYFLNAV
jgi:hypothetical protein